MAETTKIVDVFRSPREEGLYLYISHEDSLDTLPEELLKHFGPPQKAISLKLSADRKLARAKASDVLQQIDERGYYLQLPPSTNPDAHNNMRDTGSGLS